MQYKYRTTEQQKREVEKDGRILVRHDETTGIFTLWVKNNRGEGYSLHGRAITNEEEAYSTAIFCMNFLNTHDRPEPTLEQEA